MDKNLPVVIVIQDFLLGVLPLLDVDDPNLELRLDEHLGQLYQLPTGVWFQVSGVWRLVSSLWYLVSDIHLIQLHQLLTGVWQLTKGKWGIQVDLPTEACHNLQHAEWLLW